MSVAVLDASALVALLLDAGPAGTWVHGLVVGAELAAPDLFPYETANIIRRHELAQLISTDLALQAHHDLLELAIELWPHELLARRAWELRRNLSIYDAAYVALAERLQAPLVTLDARLSRAPGVTCAVAFPEDSR